MSGLVHTFAPDFTVGEGDVIEYQGKQYVVVKCNNVNWRIADRAGKTYNLRNTAPVQHKGQDWDWFTEVMRAKAPEGPRFKVGDVVVIDGKGAGQWRGREAKILKVNQVRYRVLVDGYSQVNVPFAMVREP